MSKSEFEQYKQYVSTRLNQIVPMLQKYAMGDFSENIKVPEKEDEFTELLVGLSLMLDDIKDLVKAKSSKTVRTSTKIEGMIDVIQNAARGDYSVQVELLGENDELDSLAIGINMMIEDIQENTKEIEKKQELLQEKIEDLEKSDLAALNIMEDLHETTETLEKTQKTIGQKNIELEKLNNLKSAFLNITSHELRAPMASIKGYIQMLLKQKLGEINKNQKSALEVVHRNANRLDNLIQDILDVSHLESGTMKFIQEDTVIGKMVEEVAETMQSSAAVKDIKLNTEIGRGIPDLFIDQARIEQVIINLTNNAIKFSPDKSVINLKAKKEQDGVLFEVQDFGRGIPEDKQDKVFETFYQVDSGTDIKFGGAGLGLAISRGIIIAHGGKIWVESEGISGKGSTFRFTLPIKSVKDIEKRFKGVDIFRLEKENITGDGEKGSGSS